MAAGTESSQATIHSDGTKQAGQSENHKRNHQARSTTSGLLSGQEKPTPSQRVTQIKCVCCSQQHWSDECSKYSTLQARREKLKGSCFVCLWKGHLSKECTSDKDQACAHCGKRKHHHRNLCPKLFSNSNATTNTRPETELSNIEQKGDGPRATAIKVLMQTATTVVKDIENNSSATVRLILDSGSQRTYVTKQLADELMLKLGELEGLSVITFGVNQPKQIQSQSGQVQLVLKNKDTMALTVNVVPDITGKITCFPLILKSWNF